MQFSTTTFTCPTAFRKTHELMKLSRVCRDVARLEVFALSGVPVWNEYATALAERTALNRVSRGKTSCNWDSEETVLSRGGMMNDVELLIDFVLFVRLPLTYATSFTTTPVYQMATGSTLGYRRGGDIDVVKVLSCDTRGATSLTLPVDFSSWLLTLVRGYSGSLMIELSYHTYVINDNVELIPTNDTGRGQSRSGDSYSKILMEIHHSCSPVLSHRGLCTACICSQV